MIVFMLVTLALSIGFLAIYFWISTIIDIIKSDFQKEEVKYIWLVAVLVFPFVSTIVYHFVSHQFKKELIDDRDYGFVEANHL